MAGDTAHRRRSSRSRSPGPSRAAAHAASSRRPRSPSPTPSDDGPPPGVAPLDADDFFRKSTELKLWLDEEKGKRLDQLSSSDAKRYFKKFVKAWNRGRLGSKFYDGIASSSLPSSLSSSYAWSFTKATQRELDDASSIRKNIDFEGRTPSAAAKPVMGAQRRAPIGPSLPSAVEALQSRREEEEQARWIERGSRKDEHRKAARESREEERDSRATGRDRLLEKKREGNEVRRAFKEGREEGMLEVDEETLMGGGGSSDFKRMVEERDRRKLAPARVRREEEKKAVWADKAQQFRTKEQETMDSLRALAAARFG